MVSFVTMTTAVAATALWRTRSLIIRLPAGWLTGYLSFILALTKTVSALLYAAFLVPLVRWTSPRMQIRVAVVLVIITLSYPMLRVAGWIPTAAILEVAYAIDTDRGDSLKTRFVQEEKLLDHALERPWFGWGRFGRSRLHDGYNGRDSSITDGHWVIALGMYGLVGFAAEFGLLALSVFRAAAALKYAQTMRERQYLAAVTLIVAISIFDQLPNAPFTPWCWLLVGTLLGRAEALHAAARLRRRVRLPNLNQAPMASRAMTR
jgi:hypothetical protein